MTQTVTVTFLVGFTYIMTIKRHEDIRGRRDIFHGPKGNVDLCGRFDLVCDQKKQCVIGGGRDQHNDPKGHVDCCSLFDLVYDPKSSHYFMNTKVNLTFDLDLKVKHLTLQVTTNV